MLVAIFVLRLVVANPNEGFTSLYLLPIALVAVELGAIAGLVMAAISFALFVLWVSIQDVGVSLGGHLTRIAVFASIALLVGITANRVRRTRAQVAESAADLDRWFEMSNDLLCQANFDGYFTRVGDAWEETLGYSKQELMSRPYSEFIHPEDLGPTSAAASQLAEGSSEVARFENRYRGKNGSWHWLRWSACSDQRCIYAVARDVTDTKRTERYHVMQHRAALLLSQSPAIEDAGRQLLPILAIDGEWDLAMWLRVSEGDRAPREAFWPEGSSDEPEGLLLEAARDLSREFAQAQEAVWWDRSTGPPVPGSEAISDAGAATLWLPILADGETRGAFLLVAREERKRDAALVAAATAVADQFGQFLARANAEAEAERLKEEFFNLISHELRTPLTSIIGYAELLEDLEAERLSDEGRRFLGVIERNARRQLRLVHDLLLLVRLEAGEFSIEPVPTDLREVIDEVVEQAAPRADAKRIGLETSYEEIPPLSADPHRLGQLLDNLLANAIKFTPDEGRVELRLQNDREGNVVIEVSDTGIGIGPDEKERLFERLFRASSAKELAIPGTGLGLTIVKAVTEAHGGTIEVETEEGIGTTFRVKLPVTAATADAHPRGSRAGGPARSVGE